MSPTVLKPYNDKISLSSDNMAAKVWARKLYEEAQKRIV